MAGPLDGVRVLDLTRLLPGNYCAWVLASLGADVVKVEDPGAGDYMRDFGAQVDGQGALHHLVNRGKRSVVADLKTPEGVEILHRLVDGADALVESFRPGVMDRLGVGFDALRRRRPGLVYANVTGFGATGPLASRAGHDLNYIAFAGLLERLGRADGPPVAPPLAIADLIGGGMNTAIGVLAMLFQARSTGVGGRVDTALAEGAALLPTNLVADVLAGAEAPGRGEAEFAGGSAAYDVYRLADGYITVGAVEPQFWKRMAEILDEPDLVAAKGDTGQDDFIRERLRKRFSELTRVEATELFAEADTCVEVVQSYEEMLVSPQAVEAGYLAQVPGLSMPVLAPPYLIDGSRPEETRPAPRQGENTVEVLRDLGYDEREITSLRARCIAAPRASRPSP